MIILRILPWLLLVAESLLALPILYLCVLSAAAVYSERRRKIAQTKSVAPASHADFAILIPAHDEEMMLGTLLENLSTLTYPRERYTVYVVADNCTDTTAELARKSEQVQVYERTDQAKRGKGYALQWLMQELEAAHRIHDAYVILDADSIVCPTFLLSMNRELLHGAQALQACYTVLNATASPGSALRWIALALVNHVRPLGRNGLGGSSTLNGNGMCLSRNFLQRYPWQSFSLAEDYHYYLSLVENGERVQYVPDAVVRSQMPTTFAQMRTQDIRWESSGGGRSPWGVALRLLSGGIRQRDFVRIEALAELITPPLSLLVAGCLFSFVLSMLIWSWPGLLLSMLLIVGLMVYIGSAFYLLRPPKRVYRALLYAPTFMLWKLWVYFVLSRSKKHTSEWVRTSRAVE
jgi:cellulose synthase/poly-beta-1,6-N-acetylglucosamine synthase-like glycosyltransferase